MSLMSAAIAKKKAFRGLISAGWGHLVVVDKNKRSLSWGYNVRGQLGDNSTTDRNTPVSIAGTTKTFCHISAGEYASIAIDKNGRAWGWGVNGYGQIGDNTITQRNTPVSVVGAVKTFCKISAGWGHTLAIDKNGRAWGWGYNYAGAIGDNSIGNRLTPVSVVGSVKTFCEISGGSFYSLGLDKNGRAWAWGVNASGQLGDNSTTSRRTPVSVAGTVKTFCKISAGAYYHSLALDSNGVAWAWGYNLNGQLGNNSTASRSTPARVGGQVKTFCKISAGASFSLALDKNGRAWGWGLNSSAQLGDNSKVQRQTPVSVLGAVKTFCSIAAGDLHSLAIEKNGKMWAWGSTLNGQLGNNIKGVNTERTPVSVAGAVKTFCAIAGNARRAAALDKNGKVWSWGDISYSTNLPTNINATPVSLSGSTRTFCKISGNAFHYLAIDKNGRVWGWGDNIYLQINGDAALTYFLTPISIAGAVKTFCAIGAGDFHSAAIDKYGKVWTWGYGFTGQLGQGSGVLFGYSPANIVGPTRTFCTISAGSDYCLAIDKNGRAWAWGAASGGKLGDNNASVARASPVSVLGAVKTFCKISAGAASSAAIDKNGRVWTWGGNFAGQLGINSTTSRLTPVSVLGAVKTFCVISAARHCLALDKNGRAWGWGYNSNGELGDNSATSRLTPVSVAGTVKTFCDIVSTSNNLSYAIDKNGRAWAWGSNSNAELGTNRPPIILTPVQVCNI